MKPDCVVCGGLGFRPVYRRGVMRMRPCPECRRVQVNESNEPSERASEDRPVRDGKVLAMGEDR